MASQTRQTQKAQKTRNGQKLRKPGGAKASSSKSVAADPKDRRRARRRPILDTFALSLVVPRRGLHRLVVHDLSELGIGFDFDMEGESAETFPLVRGDVLQVRFYLNPALYLPLAVEVVRITERLDGVRQIGGAFKDQKSPGHQAFLQFLKLLDSIVDSVRIER